MNFKKVVFINGNAVGDVILSTAVIKAFKDQFPETQIAFLVRQETAGLVQNLPFIDRVLCYEKGEPMLPVLKKLWRYNMAICLDFKYRSAVVPFLAAIPVRAGMAHKRKLFLSHPVERDKNEEMIYETQNFASIIERSTGIKVEGSLDSLYISPATLEENEHVTGLLSHILEHKVKIALAPFSSNKAKNWDVKNYEQLVKKLNDGFSVEFLLLGSARDKEEYAFQGEHVTDLRGKTTLTEVAEVLRRADYFIGSCSGPIHMAAAAELPILALYGSTSAMHWAPKKKTMVIQHPVECSPCDRKGYACEKDHICMKLITLEEVYEAFRKLMAAYPKER